MSFLADTNILRELAKLKPNPGVLDWARQVDTLQLSVVTIEEILFGLTWRPNVRILNWVDAFLEHHCSVLPVTEVIARRAGQLRGQLRAGGKTRKQADMLLAGTAAVHGLTLVTRNTKDFRGCGIVVLNPFTA